MAYIPSSDSVVAFQSRPSSLLVGASIIGLTPVAPNPSSVFVVNPVSIIAVNLQSTNASIITVGGGTTGNSSVTAFQGGAWTVSVVGNMNSSVTAFQGGAWSTSITGGYVNVIGSVLAVGSITALQGTNPWQVNMPSPSVIAVHIAGSVLAVRTDNASVIAVLSNSSVAVLQGTTPWTVGTTSVQLISTSASIIANQNYGYSSVMLMASTNASVAVLASQNTNPWVIGSIVGTYAEDSGHTTNDKGLFVLGIRNDLITSIASANLDYTSHATDSFGRMVIKPFSGDEASFRFQTSVVSGSVTLIQPSVIGKKSYITDFWLVNSGSVATLITWQDGSTSVLGYAVAPAGTGANSQGIHIPIATNNSQDLAFKMAPSASILYVTVNGYQSP